MKYRTLVLEISAPIAEVRLARAGDGNPIDARLLDEMDDVCARIAQEDGVHSVLITADGQDFSRGWSGAPPDAAREPLAFRCLELLPQPVLACLEGMVQGAGLELALACDIRVAGEGATFALPHLSAAEMPALGGTQRLPRLVGPTVASRMLLLGDLLAAGEALACGLVSAMVPARQTAVEGRRLAEGIASRGPLATRYAKEALLRGLDMPLDSALRFETDLTVILQTTADRAEGVAAFVEKRPPTFEGT